ncbi:hypothetical protein Tco_0359308 [Tanacetum coccineum]
MITKPEIKIGDEFLKILHDNSFNGVDGSVVTDHITKVLEITKWIKIPDVDKDELQLHVFSKSLSGDAEKWLSSEGTTTTWKELLDKFFHKYYPLSHTYKSKIPDDLDHKTDYFEYLYWLASKFNNYWELDKNIKNRLREFYVNGRTKGTIDDLVKYNKPCKENNKKTCSDLFFKPYLDAQDGKTFTKLLIEIILRYQFLFITTSATQTSCAKLKNSLLYGVCLPRHSIQRIELHGIQRMDVSGRYQSDLAIRKIDDMVYSEKDVC